MDRIRNTPLTESPCLPLSGCLLLLPLLVFFAPRRRILDAIHTFSLRHATSLDLVPPVLTGFLVHFPMATLLYIKLPADAITWLLHGESQTWAAFGWSLLSTVVVVEGFSVASCFALHSSEACRKEVAHLIPDGSCGILYYLSLVDFLANLPIFAFIRLIEKARGAATGW